MPSRPYTYIRSPEQSKPAGLAPAHTYGTPRNFNASSTARKPTVLACNSVANGSTTGAPWPTGSEANPSSDQRAAGSLRRYEDRVGVDAATQDGHALEVDAAGADRGAADGNERSVRGKG